MEQSKGLELVQEEFRENFDRLEDEQKAELMNKFFQANGYEERIMDISDKESTKEILERMNFSYMDLFTSLRFLVSESDKDYENLNCNGLYPSNFVMMDNIGDGHICITCFCFFEGDCLMEQYEEGIVCDLVRRPYLYGEYYKLIAERVYDIVKVGERNIGI